MQEINKSYYVETKSRYPSEYEHSEVVIIEWSERHGTSWGKDLYTEVWFKKEELIEVE